MLALTVGASAPPATSTSNVDVVVDVSPLEVSVVVTEIPKVKSALGSSAGVTDKPSESPASRVQVPSPLSVPALKFAPVGTSLMVMDMVSEPSVSTCVTSISSAMAVSSSPVASDVSIVAPSASVSGSTTVTVVVTVFVSPSSSVAVALTVKSKSPEPAGTSISRSATSPASSVQVPSPLSVPAVKVAPSGRPETVTDRVSEPSVSVRLV